ncbi:MAG: DUF362 domain-containing protein [bacterium]|nr:DUF362 domain-containing protein [bacterium]
MCQRAESIMQDSTKLPVEGEGPLSRRGFIARAGAAAALGLTGTNLLRAGETQDLAGSPAQSSGDMSRVVEIRSDHVLRDQKVDPRILRDMLRRGLLEVTGAADERSAWRTLLSPDDVVGLKFNQSGADTLRTTPAMVGVLVASLTDAGWDPSRLVPVEIPHELHSTLGTTPPRRDWLAEEVRFGEASDRLSGLLEQVTAIVNVPFLKHHNIAGMTCCLKNLSHALVKHPGRLHGNKCSPYIGDVVSLPQVRSKLRLHLVNALRIVTDKGPEAGAKYIVDRGALVIGLDPVAVDSLGLEILNRVRHRGGLGKIEDRQGEVSYLAAASARGLGNRELHRIDYVRHRL